MGQGKVITIPSPEVDFDAWAGATAGAVREGNWSAIDRNALAEELEGMARSDFHAVRNRLRVLIAHLLKWDGARENSWRRTVSDQRDEIWWIFKDSPSLEARVLRDDQLLRWAWMRPGNTPLRHLAFRIASCPPNRCGILKPRSCFRAGGPALSELSIYRQEHLEHSLGRAYSVVCCHSAVRPRCSLF